MGRFRGAVCVVATVAVSLLPACWTITKKVPPHPSSLPGKEPAVTADPAADSRSLELSRLKPGERLPSANASSSAGASSQSSSAGASSQSGEGGRPTAKTAQASYHAGPTPPTFPGAGSPSPPNPLPSIPVLPATTFDPPLVRAIRALHENDVSQAAEAIQSLEPAQRELLLGIMKVAVRASQLQWSKLDAREAASLLEALHAAGDPLEPLAELRLEKVTFCRNISGFGRYEPWPEGQAFQPNDLTELYLEIRHLRSEPQASGESSLRYSTRLVSSLEIRDAAGRLVDQTDPTDWRRRVPIARFERSDVSRSRVRDFFLKYRFPVPSTPGTYSVTVEVRDLSTGRSARSQPLEFRVAP